MRIHRSVTLFLCILKFVSEKQIALLAIQLKYTASVIVVSRHLSCGHTLILGYLCSSVGVRVLMFECSRGSFTNEQDIRYSVVFEYDQTQCVSDMSDMIEILALRARTVRTAAALRNEGQGQGPRHFAVLS